MGNVAQSHTVGWQREEPIDFLPSGKKGCVGIRDQILQRHDLAAPMLGEADYHCG